MKKTLVTMLALILTLCFCMSATADTATPVNLPDLPLVDEPVELSVLMQRYDGAESYDKFWFWKWCEEYTGIHFNVIEYDAQVFEEKANLLFTTGEIPDMLIYIGNYLNNTRVVQYGAEEGLLMPLEDLIEQYAPNVKTVFDANPDLKVLSTCNDGHIYTLPNYGTEVYNGARSYINQTWLTNLGLEVPTTIEEFYDVLVAFKEQDANGNGDPSDEIPWGGFWDENGQPSCTMLFTAYGMPVSGEQILYLDDENQVHLPGYEDNYYYYLQMANKMWTNGLIDEDIFTQDRTAARAKSTIDRVGYTCEDSTALLSGSEEAMLNWVGLGALTSEVNDTRMWNQSGTASSGKFALSSTCSNPEAAMKFVDMFFTLEASVFFQWGPQKDSEEALGYEGWYLDENGAFDWDYPAGYENAGSWVYRLSIILPMASKPGSSEYFEAVPTVYGMPYTMDTAGVHFRAEYDKYLPYATGYMPEVYLSAEEVERKNEIVTTLNTFMASMEKKFITGAEALTEESFEAYREELRKQGVEEYIEMHQNAYNAMIGA